MCLYQPIPPVNRIERIKEMLKAAEETSEEGQDIFALNERVLGSNDQIVENMNYIITNVDVATLQEDLLNQGRIRVPYTLPSDYEDIFNLPGFSRRSERPVNTNDPNVVSIDAVLLVEDWAEMCLNDPDTDFDEILPSDITAFESLMEHGMPARLSLDSWIAKILLNVMAEVLPFGMYGDGLKTWQPEMGTRQVALSKDRHGAKLDGKVHFIGTANPGRLVWIPKLKDRRMLPRGQRFVMAVQVMIRQAETALVALARRIANYIARSIVYQHAAPKAEERGYNILTTKEVAGAVREILGEEWFDLPFDIDGEFR
jgi:hypothetical protein